MSIQDKKQLKENGMTRFAKLLSVILIGLICLAGCQQTEMFTVTFYDDMGNVLKTEKVAKGKSAVAPDAPIIPNSEQYSYEFTGWNKDFSEVTGDLKVYPTYKMEINKYTYTFLDYDDTVLKQQTTYYGTPIVPPKLNDREAPEGYRYDFESWGKEVGVLRGDITFKAKYRLVRYYTVSVYGADFTEIINTITVDEGMLPPVPREPKLERETGLYYDFLGWFTDSAEGELFDFTEPLTQNIVLYPRYEVKPFELKGKVVSFLGDSITTFYSPDSPLNSSFQGQYEYYYPNPQTDVQKFFQTWWATALSLTETTLGLNNSRGGAKVYNEGNETDVTAGMNYSRINDLGKNGRPDIIVIYMGTNDYVTTVTPTNFEFAYRTMLNRIFEVYPNVDVFVCTIQSPGSTYQQEFRARWMQFNEIICQVAGDYHLPIIDFSSIITDANHTKNTSDALHPNASGMTLLGVEAANAIKRFFGIE